MSIESQQKHLGSPYGDDLAAAKPLISVIVAAYNEESIVESHLQILCDYLKGLEGEFRWELIVVNDGSRDETGLLAERFAKRYYNVFLINHVLNRGLGGALQSGFARSQGDYVVTLDIDLSCGPDYVEKLVRKMQETQSQIVVASPYMEGGKMSHVPPFRRFLSIMANKFLTTLAPGNLTNLTCMVRVYEGDFIRSLNLRSLGMEIMPEILYKSMIMNGQIVEIPAHLDWSLQKEPHVTRRSSMKIFSHTCSILLTGFLLRPFLFIILPGILLLLFSIYPNTWMFIHFFAEYGKITTDGDFLHHASMAMGAVYQLHPHTCLIGLLSLLLAIQLISSGFQSLQNKRYFEETFSLITNSNMRRKR